MPDNFTCLKEIETLGSKEGLIRLEKLFKQTIS